MNALIDWYSFTVRKPDSLEISNSFWRRMVKHAVDRSLGVPLNGILFPVQTDADSPTWEVGRGRAPYTDSVRNPQTGTMVFLHPDLDHLLVEMPGRACAYHERNDTLRGIIRDTASSCTRLDITCDIRTSTLPGVFADARSGGITLASTVVTSDSGNSVYLGSPDSQRRAIVYRFAPPHPRADFLRIEHRHKSEAAKVVASYLVRFGLEKTLLAAAAPFKWEHPDWKPGAISFEPMPPYTSKSGDGGQLRWVLTQVLPALRKYEREGIIPDLRQFLEDNLYNDGDQLTG